MKYLVDTNVLLRNLDAIKDYEVVIVSYVLREIDKHKSSRDSSLAYQARRAQRYINDNEDKITIDIKNYKWTLDDTPTTYVDDFLIQACHDSGYGIITGDMNLKHKAIGYKIPYVFVDENPDNEFSSGVRELFLSMKSEEDQELLAKVFSDEYDNFLDLKQNEYLLLWDKDAPTFDDDGNITGYKLIDKGSFKWDGFELVKTKWKKITSRFMGDIKPRNHKQELLFDMLQNPDVTVKACFGKFGTGKDFCMLSHAVSLIESHKFDKIVFVRNNIELEDSEPLGFRKGDLFEKLVEFAMPLADHLGGVEGLKMMVDKGLIELQHLGTLRGRDIKRSIVYVTEVQNNTINHIKLLLGRIGEGSQLWLNGDLKQIDKDSFKYKNGVMALSALSGNELFSQVVLDKTERSKTANLAELI
jgi:predicted ribonuclease YlaK